MMHFRYKALLGILLGFDIFVIKPNILFLFLFPNKRLFLDILDAFFLGSEILLYISVGDFL